MGGFYWARPRGGTCSFSVRTSVCMYITLSGFKKTRDRVLLSRSLSDLTRATILRVQGSRGRSRDTGREVIVVIQARGDILDQGECDADGKKWPEFGFILKVKQFADRLDMGREGKRRSKE